MGNPWLDAGIVGFSTMSWSTDKEYWDRWFPAELVTESFLASSATGSIFDPRDEHGPRRQAPFKTLFGYAFDEGRRRPRDAQELGQRHRVQQGRRSGGVDAMRWLYASHIPDQNLLFGYKAIAESRKKLITLWNVYSFFVTYANVDDFDPQSPLSLSPSATSLIAGSSAAFKSSSPTPTRPIATTTFTP
ncbi:MAG: hypothetical protein R3B70_25315 [Polyangiaceae bacterium]